MQRPGACRSAGAATRGVRCLQYTTSQLAVHHSSTQQHHTQHSLQYTTTQLAVHNTQHNTACSTPQHSLQYTTTQQQHTIDRPHALPHRQAPVTPSRMPIRMSALRGSAVYTCVPPCCCLPLLPAAASSACPPPPPPPPPPPSLLPPSAAPSGRGIGELAVSGFRACRLSMAYSGRHSSSSGFRWSGSGGRGRRGCCSPACKPGRSNPAPVPAVGGRQRHRVSCIAVGMRQPAHQAARQTQEAGMRAAASGRYNCSCCCSCCRCCCCCCCCGCRSGCGRKLAVALVRLFIPPGRPHAIVCLGPRRPAQHLQHSAARRPSGRSEPPSCSVAFLCVCCCAAQSSASPCCGGACCFCCCCRLRQRQRQRPR